jgi:hypothetical protein
VSGGGSSGPTSSTVTQTNVPAYAQPYVEQMLGQGQALTGANNQYPTYQGQQVAGFNPLQQQAYGNIQQMTPSSQLNQATGLAGLAGTNQFTGNNVNQYMSPYMNDVMQQQIIGANQAYGQSLPQMEASASQAGGLGGTRDALVQSQAQRGLAQNIQGIQATGLQNAFQNAQNQFNTSNQNLLGAAGTLGGLGSQQYQQQAGIDTAQLGAGQQQQGQQQNLLNTQYQNYMNQINYPYQQLGFMSNLIHGLPLQNFGTTQYAAPGSTAGQVAGLSAGLGSLFGGIGGG